jgi:hypothetical protein
MFDNLLFPAVDALPPMLLQRVFPFDMDTLVPYEPQLLADWPAALYNRDVGLAAEDAREHMISIARELAPPPVSSEYQPLDARRFRRTYQVTSVSYQLVLLPVWIASVERGGGRSLALVNGQSGKVAFGHPVQDPEVSADSDG